MVTSDAVELACTEVSDYSEQQMASEFERFFKAQPEICDFVAELTSDSGHKVQELSLFLSYMIFKSVERSRATPLQPITHGAIESAFHESERWIGQLNEGRENDVPASILSSFDTDNEPHLLQYVITEINQPPEDDSPLTDEEKGEVFFVLKTVISTLMKEIV
jgi:hypothetical protein